MSSGLDTLLEAARYLELQEQQNLILSPSPPSTSCITGRYHNQQYSQNMINSSNSMSNNKTNIRINPVSSSDSPVFVTNNGSAGSNQINNEILEFNSVVPSIVSRSGDNRIVNGTGVISHNGSVHNVLAVSTEDSSQSSANLSSSGYGSGSSANSSVGSNTSSTSTTITSGVINGDHQIPIQTQTSGRRRTTSTNSNGAGTREVHNKLEKHRRAHLKECFETLKIQLQLKDEEKKKTSNLAILGAAYRHVMTLRRKERELEQQVEQLAKDKINAQKKILSLKRELSAKYDNIDFSSIISDGDIANTSLERVSETSVESASLPSGKNIKYNLSSSFPNAAKLSSLNSEIPTNMSTLMSPVVSISPNTSPVSPHLNSSSPVNVISLSLATKIANSSLQRVSPTPSTPSPSSSSSGLSSSPPMISPSPPMGNSPTTAKLSNFLNGVKLNVTTSSSNSSVIPISTSSVTPPTVNLKTSDNEALSSNPSVTIPLDFNSSQHVLISHASKDTTVKNVCTKITESPAPSSPARVLPNNNNIGCFKDIKVEEVFEAEQPTKVIKLFNGIALAPVDKDNKILSSTPLVVGSGGLVVSPFPMLATASSGLRVIGANGLATIELSTPPVQQQNRTHHQNLSPPPNVSTTTSGTQLHKLLVTGSTTGSVVTASTINHTTDVASELARLPGGAELNILPGVPGGTTLYRGNGKLAIVNNSLTLKGSESSCSPGRAVHVVTPIQPNGTQISGLTPIVVSQGQPGSNIAQIIASTSQLAGKVNLSVGGQTLPIISTQYLSSMKPIVVAVASGTTATIPSLPPTSTSVSTAETNS